MLYTKRPDSRNSSARIAWDELSHRAKPVTVVTVWFDRSQDDGYWCAELECDSGFIEMDALEVRDRKNNPHKYMSDN